MAAVSGLGCPSLVQVPAYFIRSTGNVDVAVPANLKATFSAIVSDGKIYSDLDLAPGKKLNGGGVPIMLEATSGDIYLRTQK